MRLEYFRMIDRVERLDLEARSIRAACAVPDASPVFEGHFPGHPLLPGVLMIETMAQAGGWLLMAMLQFDRIPFLAQVKEAKLRAFVTPGQKLTAEAALLHDGSGYAVASGRILAGEKLAAEAEILYRVVPFPNQTLRHSMLSVAREIGAADPAAHV